MMNARLDSINADSKLKALRKKWEGSMTPIHTTIDYNDALVVVLKGPDTVSIHRYFQTFQGEWVASVDSQTRI